MLCGIGGRTIAEAQESVSYSEFQRWVRYRAKRGSLNVGMRVEHAGAMLAAMYANAHSKDGGFKLTDFAPYHDQPAMSLEAAMKEWN